MCCLSGLQTSYWGMLLTNWSYYNALLRPVSKLTRNKTRKTPKHIFATTAAVEATPQKPNMPARSATSRNTQVYQSISYSLLASLVSN